ncbi:AI-2E family transporter [Microbacterium saperdae]|uniref:Putative PurR-regulated permease PerM n=1 Tax=Microbacterium saperdae TaxID=69368 RepID=A0A543BAY8_9MICO|nr:AI-2E family transporter [Microbacterium saperdae]TQL81976.1 putative PurR-regulated permease PerM [Microbacterium saperdae]GGM36243.1 AI-2E family transporter [Microbacterium saperdae]
MSNDESPASAPAEKAADGASEKIAQPAMASVPVEAAPSEQQPARRIAVEPMTPSRSFWTRIDRPFVFGFLVTLGALGAILLGLALSNLATVLIYIALALFAALGLDPSVRFLERRGLRRAVSVLIVILSLIVVVALILWMVLPVVIEQIASFVRSVPGMIADFQRSDVYATLEKQFGDQFEDLVADVQKFLTDPGNIATIGGGALKVGASIATGISGVIVVLVLTLYFVASLPGMKQSLLRLVPARDRARTSEITDQITDSVGGYVMGMVVLAFFNAVLAFLLYFFLGLPFPPLMATVAFCITLIPLVGSVMFWIIGTTLALFTNPVGALIFAIVYLVYMQIEAYVITPRVMNKAISIPGSLVVIGALAGGTLLGLLGALVAVPVAASILIIIKQVWIPRQDARI